MIIGRWDASHSYSDINSMSNKPDYLEQVGIYRYRIWIGRGLPAVFVKTMQIANMKAF